jgi:hypothetical protein
MQTLLTADFWILLATLVAAFLISLRIRAWRRSR